MGAGRCEGDVLLMGGEAVMVVKGLWDISLALLEGFSTVGGSTYAILSNGESVLVGVRHLRLMVLLFWRK